MHHRVVTAVIAIGVFLAGAPAVMAGTDWFASAAGEARGQQAAPDRMWRVRFGDAPAAESTRLSAGLTLPSGVSFGNAFDEGAPGAERRDAQGRQRVKPFEYSDGYKTRAKVHKIASFATLPLFVAEYAVGQKLYDGTGGSKGLHSALAGTIAGLFGVNTVTGVWNLIEASKDPNHKSIRTIHGILMLLADAGFVATAAAAEEREYERGALVGSNRASTHRTLALSSMAVATVSYLMMLFGGR